MTSYRANRILGIIGLLCVWFTLKASELQAGTTLENLQTAYNEESNEVIRLEAFAKKADEEGYSSVAGLFRAAAKSEGIHVQKHAGAIRKLGAEPQTVSEEIAVKSTRENLESVLKDEAEENDAKIQEIIKQAEADNNPSVAMSFKGAQATDAALKKIFQQALSELESWKAPGKEFLVCLVCGYVTMDMTLVKCPICAAPRSKFEVVK
jgi:rubrerythrin